MEVKIPHIKKLCDRKGNYDLFASIALLLLALIGLVVGRDIFDDTVCLTLAQA
jgi:hypothetical protein